MKRMILAMVLMGLLASGTAWAAEAEATLDVNSAYVWRGITFNDGWVAQPGLDVTSGGFGINVWGNFDLDDYSDTLDKNNFSEVDLTLSYSFAIERLEIGVGVIEYLFPAGGAGTRELFVGLGLPLVGGLSASWTFYYDVDEVHSYYTEVGLAYAMALMAGWEMEVGAKAGFAGKDFALAYSDAATDGGFYDYGFSLGLSYGVTDALNLGAAVHYVNTLDKDVLPKADIANGIYGLDTEWVAGLTISYSF